GGDARKKRPTICSMTTRIMPIRATVDSAANAASSMSSSLPIRPPTLGTVDMVSMLSRSFSSELITTLKHLRSAWRDKFRQDKKGRAAQLPGLPANLQGLNFLVQRALLI